MDTDTLTNDTTTLDPKPLHTPSYIPKTLHPLIPALTKPSKPLNPKSLNPETRNPKTQNPHNTPYRTPYRPL